MMNRFAAFFSVVFVLCAGPKLLAEPWTVSVDANLTLTQNAYSDNWAGDETGALSWTMNSNSLLEKQMSPSFHKKTTLKLSYGQIHSQDRETKKWAKPVKSTDLIDLESVLRMTLGWYVDPFVGLRIESQFADESDPDQDRFVNPITFTESFGVARVILKEDAREWTARLGAGFRQFMNRDVLMDPQTGARETQTTSDGGIVFDTEFKTPLAEDRISYSTKLTVFKALFYSESDALQGLPNENDWKAPDVNWENIFTANVTSLIMVNLYLQLLYDKEIDTGTRIKQTLSLGLTFKLI
jgi:hypothetical protein